MKIVFITSQSLSGSTMIGRIIPVAQELVPHHNIHILGLSSSHGPLPKPIIWHTIGTLPYEQTATGKARKKGLALISNMVSTSFKGAWTLWQLQPETIVISKALPQPVAATWLYRLLCLLTRRQVPMIIFDVDDFELTANQLSSLWQRIPIHWAERIGSSLANKIIAATPFLEDHFRFITAHQKTVVLVPTGLSLPSIETPLPSNTTPRLLYAGSISIRSGHRVDLLPQITKMVLAQYPTLQLHLAGDGDDRKSIQAAVTAQQLDQQMVWHPRFTITELLQLLTSTTIIVDPIDATITQRAKSSFRVMIAIATGLPIVTSNVGIRARLIPQKFHHRFFAQPDDPQSYAEKIIDLIKHPLTTTEQTELIQHSKQYRWASLVTNYIH